MSHSESGTVRGAPGAAALGDRPLRKDALRNRDALVAAARSAFATTDGAVPLESIAREARVGIGTLYRNFPTRESLVEAVYAAELDDVTASAEVLLKQYPADVALLAWMHRYAEFVATKRGMAEMLRTNGPAGRITTSATRSRITAAVGMIISAGSHAGSLRADVDPDDVTALILGVLLSTSATSVPEQIDRLLAFIVDGLRHRADGTEPSAGGAERESRVTPSPS